MSRFTGKRGFSLIETMTVLVVLGCVVALVIGMYNYSGMNNNTVAAKQAKLESALRSATLSFMGNEKDMAVMQSCDSKAIRDLYADTFANAKVVDVNVNGKAVPSFEVSQYGVVSIETSKDCKEAWHAMSGTSSSDSNSLSGTPNDQVNIKNGGTNTSDASNTGAASDDSSGSSAEASGAKSSSNAGAVSNNSSSSSAKSSSNSGSLASTANDQVNVKNGDTNTNNASNTDNDYTETNAPITIYTIIAEDPDEVTVPASATASSRSASNDSALTANTMAFAVSSTGNLTNTYTSTVAAPAPILASVASKKKAPLLGATANFTPTNNTVDVCVDGADYSYISPECIDSSTGTNVSVKFYEMINESNCQISFCPGNGYDNDNNLITSGQINLRCKVENGTAGQCGCPEGKAYWATAYKINNSSITGICLESCADLNMVETYAGSKICACDFAAGYIWDANIQQCVKPGTCTEDYLKWDDESSSCICKTEAELLEMDPNYFAICEVYDSTKVADECKRLRENWNKITGTCVCPIPYTQEGNKCLCKDPRSKINGVCQCDFSKVKFADDEIFVNDDYSTTCTEKCDAEKAQIPDSTKTKCVCAECLKDINVTDNECHCLSTNLVTEAKLEQCGVPANYYYTATGSCTEQCNKSYKLRDTSDITSCICPATKPEGVVLGYHEFYDPNSTVTCKTCNTETTNREYAIGADEGNCYCKDELEIEFNGQEIYDTTRDNCKFDCDTIGQVADPTRTYCMPVCGCLQIVDPATNKCVCNENITTDELKQCADLLPGNIFDPTQGTCQIKCYGTAVPDESLKYCECDCLKSYNGTTCVCDPAKAEDPFCIHPDEKFDETSVTCKRCKYDNREYDANGVCVCKAPSQIVFADNEIYNPSISNCIYVCKDGAKANADHTECIGNCLQVYDYTTEKLNCIQNPTDEQTKSCLQNTNYISAPSANTCMVPCTGLTSPNDVHKECPCDNAKVTTALNQTENLNKIYDMNNSPVCMKACTGQTFPTDDRTVCRPVDCLYETTDNITQHCIPNPTDAKTKECLQNTNYISDPSAATCKVECTGLTSPNDVHKFCPCDNAKVTTALNQTENLNKIYDMNNSPVCMKACTGQTFPTDDRTVCRPVDCLYETTDNITQHCIPNPTDEQTTACLQGTNNKSNPLLATCREDCGNRRVPNNVYKVCECSMDKMADKYSSINMKFDPTSATCESACPAAYDERSAFDPATCVCPATKPSAVTIQSGYYYSSASSVLSGDYACQLACPTTAAEINAWVSSHIASFTTPKMVYDATKVGCIGSCGGNYIASADKTSCICGLAATNCEAGTYFDGTSCSCQVCPVGHYCVGGKTAPEKCPCGTYGSVTGLKTAACSGKCKEGYYCNPGSTTPTQIACTAGYICPEGSCGPQACDFPYTSTSPYVSCDSCRTEAEIRSTQPTYFGINEIYVNDVIKQCKECKSNMVHVNPNECQCPDTLPYWNGTECQHCQVWGTLYFARQEKSNKDCKLASHMKGEKGACYDVKRNVDDGMKHAASLLSGTDQNRNFGNGVYAYMVAVSPDGQSASVVGVFTARSWYNIFPDDYSSYSVNKAEQKAGTCSEMCGSNAECVDTCNYFYGKVTKNTMFSSCKYAVNNEFYGNTYNSAADELCQGGVVATSDGCSYNVGSLIRRLVSPLVLDLKGDGFEFTSPENGVVFDLNNDGKAEQTAWTPNQSEFGLAFLVLDKNGNGQVDNGGELFGDQNGSENGFLELAKYDANGDGVINKKDEAYNQLLLWADMNKNGKVDYENGSTQELKTLEEAGVTELSVSYEIVKDKDGNILTDIYGNVTGFIGSFKMMVQNAAGKLVEVVRQMMDVFFGTIQSAFN